MIARRRLASLIRFVRPMLVLALLPFYERKYLAGRHFEHGVGGFLWSLRSIWAKNILRLAPPLPWPTAITCVVLNPRNIIFHPDDLNNFQSPGTYFQNLSATITLGKGVYIAPNVGLITANHKLDDLDSHEAGLDIVIGERSWIGMGAVVLAGVTLGAQTIVAAGAVVTSSFPNGRVVIAGVPARVIKELD